MKFIDFILKNINKKWNWYLISSNPNIQLIDISHKQKVIDQLCKDYNLSYGYNKLCMLVIEHQRSLLLPMIFTIIKDRYMKINNMHVFTVTSPYNLSEHEQQDVYDFLQKKLLGIIACSYQIDSSLIAGIRLTSGTLLWEDSIKKRLKKLKNALRY